MYKEFTISYDENLNDNDKKTIDVFNSYFNCNDLKIEFNSNKIIILLREIDIDLLKKSAKGLSKCTDKPIFNDIVKTIQSIKSYGLSGKKRNYVDYNKERKVKNRSEKELKRGQFYYTIGNNFSKKNNSLPKEYVNKIICDDSYEVLKKLPDNSIDIVFTSPPYNFGLEYNKNQDDHYWQDYFNKLFKIFDECIRVLKYGGRIIVNIQPLFSDYIPSHHILSNYFLNKKLIWKGEILWEKNNYNCKYTAWGSWKSPSSPYLKYTWEFIEIFSKGDLKKNGDNNNIDITAEEFKKWVVAKWSIAPERDMKKFGHPAMFPEKLVERILKLFSFKKDIILDPFNGVGTTSLVAKKFQRKYLGIDISQEYCNTAIKRIEKLINEWGLFANEYEEN